MIQYEAKLKKVIMIRIIYIDIICDIYQNMFIDKLVNYLKNAVCSFCTRILIERDQLACGDMGRMTTIYCIIRHLTLGGNITVRRWH